MQRLHACLLASVVAGCGLIQVNGKPLGGSSSGTSSSPGASSASSTAPAEQPSPRPQPAEPSGQTAVAPRPAPAEPGGTRSLDDFERVPKQRASWTPLQQYAAIRAGNKYQAMIIADELGDRLSHAGRLAVIEQCLPGVNGRKSESGSGSLKKDATSASRWAACAADVEAFDTKALAAEVQREGLTAADQRTFLANADASVKGANEIGAAVRAAAKDDPGVAAIVAMGKTARDEWSTFAAAHADQLAELARLQDLVRENRNELAGDCLDRTRPAMVKVVRATKWRENDTPMDPNEFYVNLTPATTDAFIATAAWGACVALTHRSGNAIYEAATRTQYGWSTYKFPRYYRRGPRTLTVAKLYQDPFKPKFADRALDMNDAIENPHDYYRGEVEGSQTPHEAVIAKLVKNGDETTIKFSDAKVSRCVDWRDTNRIQNITPNGDVMYEKRCLRRGLVEVGYSDVVSATVFTSGLAAGVLLTEELGFPVVARKGNKFVAAFGIKL